MIAWLRFPLTALSLLALWLLLVGSIAPGQVLLGGVLAAVITGFTARFWPRRPRLRRPWRLLQYLVRLGVDILTANFRVALLVLNPWRRLQPLFVEMPLTIQDPFAIYLLATTISLTPGTVSADVRTRADRRGSLLLIHAMDGADDPQRAQALCRHLKRRYEEPLMEVFR
jgi:multicomponent K+:H+ antiporter subunit E